MNNLLLTIIGLTLAILSIILVIMLVLDFYSLKIMFIPTISIFVGSLILVDAISDLKSHNEG